MLLSQNKKSKFLDFLSWLLVNIVYFPTYVQLNYMLGAGRGWRVECRDLLISDMYFGVAFQGIVWVMLSKVKRLFGLLFILIMSFLPVSFDPSSFSFTLYLK